MHSRNIYSLFVPLFFLVVPHVVGAQAALYIEPSTGMFPVGDLFTVDVRIDTAGAIIGTADATLAYDPEVLEYVSFSGDGSVLNRLLVDTGATIGRVDVSGFVERNNPAYSGTNGLFTRLTFRARRAGSADVRFLHGAATPPLLPSASVGDLANIIGTLRSASYSFVPRELSPPARVAGASTNEQLLTVTPLPVPETDWFGTSTITFSWSLPERVHTMRTSVSAFPESERDTVYQVPVTSTTVTGVSEGKHEFILSLSFDGSSFVDAARIPLWVDITPPDAIVIQETPRTSASDKNTFIVEASDALSGISRYTMSIDGGDTVPWNGQGTFTPDALAPGEHVLTVAAYDKAGNVSTKDVVFFVRSLDAPVLTSVPERVLTGDRVVARGTTYPNATVKAFISFDEKEPAEQLVQSTADGAFELVVSDGARAGTYTLWFQVSDAEGSISPVSVKRSIKVSQPYIMLWGKIAVTYLSILVPLFALIVLLGLTVWLGYTFLRGYRRKVHRETTEAYDVVQEEFSHLRDDLRRQIGMLEKANQSRELTREEMKIFNDLSKRLAHIEQHIQQEIGDIAPVPNHEKEPNQPVQLDTKETPPARHTLHIERR